MTTLTTLITGATGYLGREIAARLLASTDGRLVCTIRSAEQGDRLLRGLGPAALRRVSLVPVDLGTDGCLDAIDAGAVTHIVHASAVTRFGVGRDEARRVNLDGTARVCDFAIRCGNLERFVVLSTLYTAGRRQGIVVEQPHDEVPFANHYEWSKWAAECHAFKTCAGLPLSILRLPTVIADDGIGKVSQYNAFHNTAKLFYYGLMPIVPGDPATPVNVGSAVFTVDAITHLLRTPGPSGIYHVCAGPAQTPTWGALVDRVFDVFEEDPGFRRRRVLRPLGCDADTFATMVAAAGAIRSGPIYQGLASVAPFAPQLYLPKVFRNDALRTAWPSFWADDAIQLVQQVCRRLVATRWGRA
jgi:nucleoside-diphosphate-sugar epimerase